MCKFFSAISNGKGKVLFFKLEDIHKIQQDGNKENYNFNSHTSIANYFGIEGKSEDIWNKWEYNSEKKELTLDGKLKTKQDDREEVKEVIEKYLAANNAIYFQKIYLNNSGNLNSGNWNSGNSNSGNRNSGNRNSGYSNSGNRNSGNRNSGNWNSGNWNSGNWNSGCLNSNEPNLRIFNNETKVKIQDIDFPNYFCFDLNVWVSVSDMTDEEKTRIGWYKTTEGYLKKIEYKEAWKLSFAKASKEDVALTLKLPNFNYIIFEEISGITKKMITDKLE